MWRKQNVLNEYKKCFVLPLHAQKFVQLLQSTTFHRRTIVAMFTSNTRSGLDTLHLIKTALPQTSPQLVGSSFISSGLL
jgi:hypothetical protein